MQVVKYLTDIRFQNLINLIDKKIGDGADGEVFTLKDTADVAKFSIYYCWNNENLQQVIDSRLDSSYLVKGNANVFVSLFEFKHLLSGSRTVVNGNQDYAIFFSRMEKLNKISEDEKKVFHSTLSHQDSNVKKDLSLDKISNMLDGLSIGLDFNRKKVFNFIKQVQNLASIGIQYTDLHPRNIMKTKDGDFKLIDIDRISVSVP